MLELNSARLNLRLGMWLLTGIMLSTFVLTLLLLTGQCVKIHGLLAGLDTSQWIPVLGLGVLVLLEAILPLAALIGSALVYGRLRNQGIEVVIGGGGRNPIRLLFPVVIVGVLLGAVSYLFSAAIGPHAVGELGSKLKIAAMQSVIDNPDPLEVGGIMAAREEQINGPSIHWVGLLEKNRRAPTLIRAENPAGDWGRRGPELTFGKMTIWSENVRVSAGSGIVRLDPESLGFSMRMFEPPNSLPSVRLDRRDPHHAFTWHRRMVMALLAPLWSVFGALLGLLLGSLRGILCGAAFIGIGYWGLRLGELAARSSSFPPEFAAWLPFTGLAFVTLGFTAWWARRRI